LFDQLAFTSVQEAEVALLSSRVVIYEI